MPPPIHPLPARENESLVLVYALIGAGAALTAAIGISIDSMTIAYVLPALMQAVPAVMSSLCFLIQKRNLSHWVAFGGCFLFFHLQLLSPQYWSIFETQIRKYSTLARYASTIGIHLFPVALLLVMRVFDDLWPNRARWWSMQVTEPAYQRRLFIGFVVIFVLAAIPQVLYGQVVIGAIRQIVYLRAGVTQAGESYFTGFTGEGATGSLINLQHFSTSLVLLSVLLWRSRYRQIVRSLFPFSAIWTAANVLSGTRTQLLLFALAIIVIYGADPKRRISLRMAVLVPLGVFVLSQLYSEVRNFGLRDIDYDSLRQNFGNVQGLETLHDQTRALDFFIDGYRSPWSTGFPPADFLIGLVYRPIEFFLFVLPRSIFPWKPLDPTFEDLNRLVISSLGLNADENFWGLTAGILGRDTLRWGMFGGLVALFWMGFLLFAAERGYRNGPHCLDNRVLAGAIAGSCIAMYRDLTPLWCLQMFPAVFVILYARGALRTAPFGVGSAPPGPLRIPYARHRFVGPQS
jgi:hypothetical protein